MRRIKSAILLTATFFVGVAAVKSQDAASILKKMDETVFSIKDKTVSMKMVMLNQKSGKEKVKEAILMQKGNQKLFRYTAPESDAGIATLSLPNEEIYVYLPMFKNPKKVTNLAESNAFNKSDFSIEDMATRTYSEKFTPGLISIDGEYYVLDLIPKEEKPTWVHIVVHIHKQHYYPVQFDYYNDKGEIEKQSKHHYIKAGNFWAADEVSMEDFRKEHKTTLYMSDIQVNTGLSDDLFLLENLVPADR